MKDLELRFNSTDEFTFKDDNREIEGYALLFNSESEILGDFKEVIESRALDNVDLNDVFLIYNHKYDDVLASSKSGTMDLQVTNKGLYFRANLPDTSKGNDTYKLIKRGDLSGMSFSFRAKKDQWDISGDIPKRTIKEISLIDEISIVPRPAYSEAVVSARSLEFCKECLECKDGMCKSDSNELLEKAKEIIKEIK